MRRAKIVCTVGPASRDRETLTRMISGGMDVARLNMSHGTQAEHREMIRTIREVAEALQRVVAILLDLSGPKIRLGVLQEPVTLKVGDEVTLTVEDVAGQGDLLPVNYPELVEEVRPGDPLSLADGVVDLVVSSVLGPHVRARVLSQGTVSSRKGVNVPGGGSRLPALTQKDRQDLKFGLEEEVDWVALSFVRSAADIEQPLAEMSAFGRRVPILAKIEKQQALSEIEGILDRFDGLMVARGDLGVEVALEQVPGIQKDLIRRANRRAKPVITATQMLLSMVHSPRPTRAEVTDVANAILDGSDAVMLSEESAAGKYPVAAVAMMDRIAGRAEELRGAEAAAECGVLGVEGIPAAIARATWQIAHLTGAEVIVTPTTSGSTARLVAATRPRVPVLALSSVPSTVRSLACSWGVLPGPMEAVTTTDALFELCRAKAVSMGLASAGDRIVVTAGIPIQTVGTTNLLKVIEV